MINVQIDYFLEQTQRFFCNTCTIYLINFDYNGPNRLLENDDDGKCLSEKKRSEIIIRDNSLLVIRNPKSYSKYVIEKQSSAIFFLLFFRLQSFIKWMKCNNKNLSHFPKSIILGNTLMTIIIIIIIIDELFCFSRKKIRWFN